VDVEARLVRAPAAGIEAPFPLDDFTRWRLLEGLDDIGLTLRHEEAISAYEPTRPAWLPSTAELRA
jgi:3-isopropylmalate/(R)-2-methylmalate dehydratase small subunit